MKFFISISLITAFFFTFLTLQSCSNTSDCCTTIDTEINIHYITADGQNLINSDTDYNQENIRIYYLNGDNFEYFYFGNLDYPNMHKVYERDSSDLILRVFPSNLYDGNFSTTLIELNSAVMDTLVCEFRLENNLEICTNAWLNGVQMNDRFIQVKK